MNGPRGGYFGNWSAPVTDNRPRVEVPVGEPCFWCGHPFDADSHGLFMPVYGVAGPELQAIHKECNLRSVVGSMAHLEGRCSCCGGTDTGPETPLERYQEAVAVWEHWTRNRLGGEA